ncbi:MAG TPA: thioredoxin family protein [Candidatus Limnocylindria bacterium]|nr:thioredoxin family protein [Candidatus Limnocylindria bacterium]
MRTTLRSTLLGAFAALGLGAAAAAAVTTGQPAPAFSLPGSDGKTHALADYAGKIVVLEWFNRECPFVKKHYESQNMQQLQREYTGRNVVWLTVISSAPGKQGHATASQAAAIAKELGAAPTAVLLDEQGSVGRAYGAKTTPHMYVIGKDGTLLYQGAIDDDPSAQRDGVATAKNYVRRALDETLAGKPVSEPVTTPYGCSVKY